MSKRVSTHSPAQKQDSLPVILTDSNTWLCKLAQVTVDLRDNSGDRTVWGPVHHSFERHVKQACPKYRPLKGEFFGTICDSGREGEFFRGPLCAKCQFVHCDLFAKEWVPTAKPPVEIAPAVPVSSAADPAPALTDEQAAAIAAKVLSTLQSSGSPLYDAIRQAAEAFAQQAAKPAQSPIPATAAAAQLSAWASGKPAQ